MVFIEFGVLIVIFHIRLVPEIDVSDVKLEDEGDVDFQRALEKSRLRKQKEQALNTMKKKQEKVII